MLRHPGFLRLLSAVTTLFGAGCASQATSSQATSARKAADPAPVAAPARQVPFVYVGGYRPEIRIYRLDLAAGALIPAGSVDGVKNPSFLAWSPDRRFLLAVDEVDQGRVVSFAIEGKTGALTRVGETSSEGVSPAHLSLDATGRWALVANYAHQRPGVVAVLPLGPDGRLGAAVSKHDLGQATNPHSILVDRSNRFAFVPCKGGPFVAQFRFDQTTGSLIPNSPDRVVAPDGSGPRHFDFHPGGRFVYMLGEKDGHLRAYTFDAPTGRLTEFQSVSALPAGWTGKISSADVHVHPSGRWLYASHRGDDSIAIVALDQNRGTMTVVGHETRTIATPRNFHIDPSGTLLLVANQKSHTVTLFRIDQAQGTLSPVGPPTPVGDNPSFVGVVMLPGA